MISGKVRLAAGNAREINGPVLTTMGATVPAGNMRGCVIWTEPATAVNTSGPVGNMSVKPTSWDGRFNVLLFPDEEAALMESVRRLASWALRTVTYNPPLADRSWFCSAATPRFSQSVVPFRKDIIMRAGSCVVERNTAIPRELKSQYPEKLITPPPST